MTDLREQIPENYERREYDGPPKLDWKVIREQGAIPVTFLIRFQNVEIKQAQDDEGEVNEYYVFEAEVQLDGLGLNDAKIEELERITGTSHTKAGDRYFFPVGSMFLTQMEKKYGEDWMDACRGQLAEVKYNGKVPNTKKSGQLFHQVWISPME